MERDKGQNGKREVREFQGNDPVSLFGGAPRFAYMYRKTEKVITALYMVTSFLPDEEPLKWRARRLGGELLSSANVIKDRFSTRRDETVHAIKSIVLELTSLLGVARHAGLMSEMNAKVLTDELGSLVSLLSENRDGESPSKSLVIDSSFFDDEGRDPGPQTRPVPIKDTDHRRASMQPMPNKGHASTEHSAGAAGDGDGNSHEKKEKRRKVIVELIKRKGTVTIKDVAGVIRDWSDKTLQRELLALVGEGVLKKEGERRWSRYSLARS